MDDQLALRAPGTFQAAGPGEVDSPLLAGPAVAGLPDKQRSHDRR